MFAGRRKMGRCVFSTGKRLMSDHRCALRRFFGWRAQSPSPEARSAGQGVRPAARPVASIGCLVFGRVQRTFMAFAHQRIESPTDCVNRFAMLKQGQPGFRRDLLAGQHRQVFIQFRRKLVPRSPTKPPAAPASTDNNPPPSKNAQADPNPWQRPSSRPIRCRRKRQQSDSRSAQSGNSERSALDALRCDESSAHPIPPVKPPACCQAAIVGRQACRANFSIRFELRKRRQHFVTDSARRAHPNNRNTSRQSVATVAAPARHPPI